MLNPFRIFIIILAVILISFLKNRFLSDKWSSRIIGISLLLILVLLGAPKSNIYIQSILDLLYVTIFSLAVPTKKIVDRFKSS